jgi:glyoxylase-like metal-dependent hydrolase (beta-lactamase superfamily II)
VAEGVLVRLGTWIVNWYAVQEDGRWTVFDAGVSRYWPQLEQHRIRAGDVEAVVLTHAHADHTGVAERLREAGARVYVHEDDKQLATTLKAFGENQGSLVPYLRYPMAWRLLTHLARNGGARPRRISEVTTFADGDVLDVPGRPAVIHTPGHTSGHCALYLEDRGTLLVGDLLCTLNPLTGRRGPQLLPRAFNVSTAQMLASLSKIENLNTEFVYFGHGEPWAEGVGSAVERARALGPT